MQALAQGLTMLTVFVFGSNLAGKHGKGAALVACKQWGARYGVGEGRTGNAYAIPTKDRDLKPRQLCDIEISVNLFLDYARSHPECVFLVTRIGCGLAGFTPEQIEPLFKDAPSNCVMPDWQKE